MVFMGLDTTVSLDWMLDFFNNAKMQFICARLCN